MQTRSDSPLRNEPTLVIGANGKTGRRVAELLKARGADVRHSRARATPT